MRRNRQADDLLLQQAVRSVTHVATFPVASGNAAGPGAVHLPDSLSSTSNGQPVQLRVSSTGIDILTHSDASGRSHILSSHPLRRISLASCDPERRLFAFAAREPAAHRSAATLCRVFATESPQAARELSGLIGACFEAALLAAERDKLSEATDASQQKQKQQQQQQSQQATQQYVVKPKPIPAPRFGCSGVASSNSYVASPVACRPLRKQQPPPPPTPVRCDSLRGRPCEFEVPPPPPLPPDAIPDAVAAASNDADFDDADQSWWWYRADLPREAAYKLLAGRPAGSFLVRNSASHPNCYALSVRVPHQKQPQPQPQPPLSHYLIQCTARGVKLKGLSKEWPNLHSLVCHLSVLPELLPCPLLLQPPVPEQRRHRLMRHSPNPLSMAETTRECGDAGHEKCDGSDLGDYQRFTDVNSLLVTNLRLL